MWCTSACWWYICHSSRCRQWKRGYHPSCGKPSTTKDSLGALKQKIGGSNACKCAYTHTHTHTLLRYPIHCYLHQSAALSLIQVLAQVSAHTSACGGYGVAEGGAVVLCRRGCWIPRGSLATCSQEDCPLSCRQAYRWTHYSSFVYFQ